MLSEQATIAASQAEIYRYIGSDQVVGLRGLIARPSPRPHYVWSPTWQ